MIEEDFSINSEILIGYKISKNLIIDFRLNNLNIFFSWWDELAMEAFHEKAQCIIDQYGLYTVSEVGMPLDGTNTQVMIKSKSHIVVKHQFH